MQLCFLKESTSIVEIVFRVLHEVATHFEEDCLEGWFIPCFQDLGHLCVPGTIFLQEGGRKECSFTL